MAIDTDKFILYAAHKIPSIQIAKAFGVTDGRVSQLLADQRVQDLVAAKRSEIAMEEIEEQTSLASARVRLLNRLPDLIEGVDTLGEATTALEKLTRIKDPAPQHSSHQGANGARLISLELPSFLNAKLSIELNGANEITEINNRNMATMPTLATHRLLQAKPNDQDAEDTEGIPARASPPSHSES